MPAVIRLSLFALLVAGLSVPATGCASVEPPTPVAPHENYILHDSRTVGPFTVERWVSKASPEVSPAGMCECITVVYNKDRRLLTLGEPGSMTATSIDALSGKDVNGDRQADLVVSEWSGGAHCCYRTVIYSVGEQPRELLALNTGNCGPGELTDLDGDGTLEFMTCDDGWAYAHCSFASSPMPRVVLAYDATGGSYRPATPRFAARFRDDIATQISEARLPQRADAEPGAPTCNALRPVLSLMYAGRFDEGLQLLREVYRGSDLATLEKDTVARVRQSALWVPQ